MKKIIIASVLAATLVGALPMTGFAESKVEIESKGELSMLKGLERQIQELNERIQKLFEKIAARSEKLEEKFEKRSDQEKKNEEKKSQSGTSTNNAFVKLEELPGTPRVSCIVGEMSFGRRNNIHSVFLVQLALKKAGFYPEGLITGYYGKLTSKAVERLQNEKGLIATGNIDTRTVSAINAVIGEQFPECKGSVMELLTGFLSLQGPSIQMWGSHSLQTDKGQVYKIQAADNSEKIKNELKKYENQRVVVKGKVVWNEFEGGFWGFVVRTIEKNSKIEITYPSYGEEWQMGKTYTIKWTPPAQVPATSPARIFMSAPRLACLDANPPCMIMQVAPVVIAVHVPIGQGSYTWKVPADLAQMYAGRQQVGIALNDFDITGTSEIFFVVKPENVSAVKIIAPEKGERWMKGKTYEIKWRASKSITAVDITLDTGIRCITSPCPSSILIVPGAPNVGSYSWVIPKEISDGAYRVQIASAMENSFDVSEFFSITTEEKGNQNPVIQKIEGPETLGMNEVGAWKISAFDPDGTWLSYKVDWGDSATTPTMKTNEMERPIDSQQATFTHSYELEGKYRITFIATDKKGATAQTSLTVEIKKRDITNHPPKITSPSVILAPINVGKRMTFIWEAVDPDNDPLSWKVSWGDRSANGSETASCSAPACSRYSAGHAWNTPGTYNVVVKVSDNKGGSDETSFAVRVNLVDYSNRPPVIKSISGPTSLKVNEQGTWDIGAYDPDGGTLAYNIEWGDVPQVAYSSPKTIELLTQNTSFKHAYNTGGTYQVTFTVSDEAGRTSESTITVSVSS